MPARGIESVDGSAFQGNPAEVRRRERPYRRGRRLRTDPQHLRRTGRIRRRLRRTRRRRQGRNRQAAGQGKYAREEAQTGKAPGQAGERHRPADRRRRRRNGRRREGRASSGQRGERSGRNTAPYRLTPGYRFLGPPFRIRSFHGFTAFTRPAFRRNPAGPACFESPLIRRKRRSRLPVSTRTPRGAVKAPRPKSLP